MIIQCLSWLIIQDSLKKITLSLDINVTGLRLQVTNKSLRLHFMKHFMHSNIKHSLGDD